MYAVAGILGNVAQAGVAVGNSESVEVTVSGTAVLVGRNTVADGIGILVESGETVNTQAASPRPTISTMGNCFIKIIGLTILSSQAK